uniref:Uncharacterized protein n=1 Tax=Oryza barthii TaxID=65489 RepID=A0A0D3GBD4_9ORYZ
MAARVALRRAFSATVAASPSPGMGAAASPGFSTDPSSGASSTLLHLLPKKQQESRDARMDIKRRCELKEHEFFHLVEEALKTADPVKARLVFEKRKELSDLVREYKANSGLKTANRRLNLAVIISAVVSGYFVAGMIASN